jgi:hypothetical protein
LRQRRLVNLAPSLIHLEQDYCLKRMQHDQQTLLDAAHFVKATPLVWLTHSIKHLGYAPRMIVPYRASAPYARSHHVRGGKPVPALVQNCVAVYRTAPLQIQTLGGCGAG